MNVGINLDLRVSGQLRQAQATMKSQVSGDKLSGDTPKTPQSLQSQLLRERGLGPTEETAKALLFHDPLLIGTGLATKSKVHSHKNMILQRGKFCWLRGCIWWKKLYGSFSLLSSVLFAVFFFFFYDSGFLFYFL